MLARCEQLAAIECECISALEHARLEVFAAPHQQRRPAELVTGANRLYAKRVFGATISSATRPEEIK